MDIIEKYKAEITELRSEIERLTLCLVITNRENGNYQSLENHIDDLKERLNMLDPPTNQLNDYESDSEDSDVD